MSQLSDDCFAFGGELMSTTQALSILEQRLSCVAGEESLPLGDALGRFLARDVIAPRNVPPHDNAAVDGYAVYFSDLAAQGETRLNVAGRIAAGHLLPQAPRPGAALRIFTGAPMPKDENGGGPDTVLMQEDCREDGQGFVIIPPGIKKGANRRQEGEDIGQGALALRRGSRLRPQDIGLAAALGLTTLSVYRPLRVAVFSTGDEVRDPGDEAPSGTIYDSNRAMLRALLQTLGCSVGDLGILPDRHGEIVKALQGAAVRHDLVITSGGVSTGEEDHVRAALNELGSLHFWRLAIKPGRPLALGQIGRGEDAIPFIGLPGNPVAVMITFLRFARPAIIKLSGGIDLAPPVFRVRAGFSHRKKAGRREWLRAHLAVNAEGTREARKFPREGSGILSSLVAADGLVELGDETGEIREGDLVDFLPFSGILT